jgi:hypothetical protein
VKGFQAKTLALFDQVNGILAEYDVPLTLRQVYYRLVAAHIIPNTERAYKNLSARLTDGRRAGRIDPRRITDRLREASRVSCWDDLPDFLQAVRQSYRREKWTSQPVAVEVWCEKDALGSVLEPITDRYEVTLYVGRGYSSYSAMMDAADRIKEREQRTVVLYFGDFDPSGQDMPRDIRDRLAADFDVEVDLRVIALTPEQIAEHNLPPAPAKKTDTRAAAFVAKHGDLSVELDALPPDVLQALVRDGIEGLMDLAAFGAEADTEAEEQEQLAAVIDGIAG